MKRKNIILVHLLFWFYIINQGLFPLYTGQLDEELLASNQYFKDVAVKMILNLISFYLVYFSFPALLKIRHRITAIFTCLMLIAMITAFRAPVEYYFWKLFGCFPGKDMEFKTAYVWNNLRLVVIIGIYAILIRFMLNWFESQKLRTELVNQQQASELALMRSQVNPHFLFNTLNNIYSLVYRKSDEAPGAVMKLSSIMRYMLYDSASQKVALDKEVEYLRSYIELQNMRTKSPDFVTLQIDGNTEGQTIAPMLLISFVENAFKHSNKNQRPGILVHLYASKGKLNFEVINYLRASTPAIEEPSDGIGLATIRRRLELIYPGKHKLLVSREKETFRINLEIQN
jgi:hypothetical protein